MGQHDKDQVNETTKLETIAPSYVDNKCVMSRHSDRYVLSWRYLAGVRTGKLGFRLQISHVK